MTAAKKPWPPLIVADRVPRLVRWRDALLTLIMWAALAALFSIEFAPLRSALQGLGLGEFGVTHDWLQYLEKLTPFLLTAALLTGLLVLFSLRTVWRRSRAMLLPQPAPLDLADQARRAGLDEETLLAAREQRVVVVHIGDNGRWRVEAKDDTAKRRPPDPGALTSIRR